MDFMDLTQPEYSYMSGFLQTDGCLTWSSRLRGRVSVEIKRADESILHDFQRLCPYNSSITRRERDTNFKADYQSSTWTMCSLEGRVRLIKLGLIAGRKSSWVAPPSVDHSSIDYVRGLIDGDGSVGFTARGYPFVSFVTASAFLVDYVSDYAFEAVGCRRRVLRNSRDGVFNLMFASDPAADLARNLYPAECLALDRKKVLAREISEWQRPAGMRARVVQQRWTPEHDAIVLSNPVPEAALLLGRNENSCAMRRWRLTRKVADGR